MKVILYKQKRFYIFALDDRLCIPRQLGEVPKSTLTTGKQIL